MQSRTFTKLTGFLAFLAVVAGATVAAWDYESTSSSSRGRGLETVWHGVLALVGQEENATSDMIWLGRGLALLGVALLALYVMRRVRGHRPAAAGQQQVPPQYAPAQQGAQQAASPQQALQPYAPGQYAAPSQPQRPEPQAQWSAGGPQPAPALSWGAVTSGPTPLPPRPQEQPEQDRSQAPQARQPDPADMTREVIIPPLPPGWGRS